MLVVKIMQTVNLNHKMIREECTNRVSNRQTLCYSTERDVPHLACAAKQQQPHRCYT